MPFSVQLLEDLIVTRRNAASAGAAQPKLAPAAAQPKPASAAAAQRMAKPVSDGAAQPIATRVSAGAAQPKPVSQIVRQKSQLRSRSSGAWKEI